MAKRIVNIRLRPDQEEKINAMRGAKRDSRYIEVRAHRSGLAAYVGYRRGHEKDRRCGEVPRLSNFKKTRRAKKAAQTSFEITGCRTPARSTNLELDLTLNPSCQFGRRRTCKTPAD